MCLVVAWFSSVSVSELHELFKAHFRLVCVRESCFYEQVAGLIRDFLSEFLQYFLTFGLDGGENAECS